MYQNEQSVSSSYFFLSNFFLIFFSKCISYIISLCLKWGGEWEKLERENADISRKGFESRGGSLWLQRRGLRVLRPHWPSPTDGPKSRPFKKTPPSITFYNGREGAPPPKRVGLQNYNCYFPENSKKVLIFIKSSNKFGEFLNFLKHPWIFIYFSIFFKILESLKIHLMY